MGRTATLNAASLGRLARGVVAIRVLLVSVRSFPVAGKLVGMAYTVLDRDTLGKLTAGGKSFAGSVRTAGRGPGSRSPRDGRSAAKAAMVQQPSAVRLGLPGSRAVPAAVGPAWDHLCFGSQVLPPRVQSDGPN